MSHPLVDQLRFTRHEWLRGLSAVQPEEATRHLGPMNCISWIVGHLAWQEQGYWLFRGLGEVPYPDLHERFRYGAPMCTPDLERTMIQWRKVTQAADRYLDGLAATSMEQELLLEGKPIGQSIGSALLRMTYHYWYHIGEIQAIRQMLGHTDLPDFVGDLEGEAPYAPMEGEAPGG
jgi:hypothetical protein